MTRDRLSRQTPASVYRPSVFRRYVIQAASFFPSHLSLYPDFFRPFAGVFQQAIPSVIYTEDGRWSRPKRTKDDFICRIGFLRFLSVREMMILEHLNIWGCI